MLLSPFAPQHSSPTFSTNLFSKSVSLFLPWKYINQYHFSKSHSVQFSSVTQSCPTPCNPMNRSTPGLPVYHQLPEYTQTHVHWVGDALQPPHPLSSPSPPALNLSQDQGLFKWVSSLHQVAKVLEFQLQHQSFKWPQIQWTRCHDLSFLNAEF